ncbi:hypothetical protein BDR26DRAFT_865156 [Obelidium mucronatum]|nr:hypothetical protein BDR26DRAFT_865156 [Obelidium mucronatum]
MRLFSPNIIVIILMMMMIVIAPLVHANPVPPPPTSPTQSIDDNKSHQTTTTTTRAAAASDPPKGFHRVMKVVKHLKVIKVVRKYSLVNGPCGDGWPKSPVCYKGLVCVESSEAVGGFKVDRFFPISRSKSCQQNFKK